jgi:hypothetical protein
MNQIFIDFNLFVVVLSYLNETDDFKGQIGQKREIEKYQQDVYNTKFQIAAPGVGWDCWRNTETFMSGIVTFKI